MMLMKMLLMAVMTTTTIMIVAVVVVVASVVVAAAVVPIAAAVDVATVTIMMMMIRQLFGTRQKLTGGLTISPLNYYRKLFHLLTVRSVVKQKSQFLLGHFLTFIGAIMISQYNPVRSISPVYCL